MGCRSRGQMHGGTSVLHVCSELGTSGGVPAKRTHLASLPLPRDRCTPHCNAPEVLHATALVQQGLKPRISTSFSSADMRSWRSERSKVSSFATSPLRVQLPASANPPTTLPNHPHARKPNPLKAGARARRNHRLPGLDEGARAAPMGVRPLVRSAFFATNPYYLSAATLFHPVHSDP